MGVQNICLNACYSKLQYLPLKHPENKILTEQQPKDAKLLCCFSKAKLVG